MRLNRFLKTIPFTQTQLKLIAAFFMTFGSIAVYGFKLDVVAQNDSFFRALGWISAPVFLYCLLESLRHTGSRPKLLLRLYIANILFSLLMILLNLFAQPAFGFCGIANAFASLFFAALCIVLLDALCKAISGKDWKTCVKTGVVLLAIILWCVAEPHATNGILSKISDPEARLNATGALYALLPSLRWLDYTAPLVAFGVLWYFIPSRKWQLVAFAGFCLALFLASAAGVSEFRHMRFMVFALPLLLLYNGQRGRGFKYFFYLFYPAHILLLLFLNTLLG